MKRFTWAIVFILACVHTNTGSANEEIVGVGMTAKFIHEAKVFYSNQSLYKGRAFLSVSRPDADTHVISAHKFPKSENADSLVFDAEGSLVLHSLQGRIASVLIPRSADFLQNLNYLRAMASILFVSKESYSLSYHMVTDLFGTCEAILSRNGSTIESRRDLKRCSHFSIELPNSINFLPLLHVGLDMTGSISKCSYLWEDSSRQKLMEIACRDDYHIAARFSQESEIHLELESNIKLTEQIPITNEVYESIHQATETTDLILDPLLIREPVIEEEELETFMAQLCATSRDHVTKDDLLLFARVFYAFSRARSAPNILKYPCSSNIRRNIAFIAALVGGPRFLNFVHDQMMQIVDEGLDLMPNFPNPLITIAISNLGEPKLNPHFPVSLEFFIQRENVEKMEKVIEMLLVAGSGAFPGVTNLLERLKILSPNLFEDTIIRAAVLITPEQACASGNAEEATRILHAVSALRVRPSNYVASLRPCFATENVGVQVAAMNSLRTLECDAPGVLELQQLALESPSDPEIRIAAFKGIVKCISGRPALIRLLQSLMDPDAENYSKQVASFVWSYLKSVLASLDPSLIDIRLELEEAPTLARQPDPVSYDPRRFSRHLEYSWVLDPRTAFTGVMEFVWGRASPAPRSVLFGITLFHDQIPYDFIEITLRFTGLERTLWAIPGLRNVWNSLMLTSNDIWSIFQENVENFWRGKREVNQTVVHEFIQQVIARIPADFQETGSSLEFSLSLFGMPVYHFHHAKIDSLLNSFTYILISKLKSSNLYSEIFQLSPLLENTILLGTTSGVPISFRLGVSNGIHSLLSHYADTEKGSMDFVVSGGFVTETRLKIGHFIASPKKGGSESHFRRRRTEDVYVPELFSDLATHCVWAIDVPLSFNYETKGRDMKMIKFRRPAIVPHYLWLDEKVTTLNHRPFPIRSSTKCNPEEEAIKLCFEVSEHQNFSDQLNVLNNPILRPEFYGIKLDLPKGYEPILLHVEEYEATANTTSINLRVKIPTNDRDLNYEAIMAHNTALVNSISIDFNTPTHKYYAKTYWSFLTHSRWLVGVEGSIDEKPRGIKFQLSFPKVASQRLVTPSVSITTPEKEEEEVLKGFFVIKDFVERSSIEFSGSSHGLLKELIDIHFSGEMKRKKTEFVTEIFLEELKIKTIDSEVFILKGRCEKSLTGIQSSTEIKYGLEYDVKSSFSYNLGDFGSSVHLLPPEVIAKLVDGVTFEFSSHIKYPGAFSPVSLELAGSTKKRELELDLNVQNAKHGGKFLFFAAYESIQNFRSILSVDYFPENISWTVSQEFLWKQPEYKVGFNASWSINPEDHFAILCYVRKDSLFQHSLSAYVVALGQTVEIFHDVSKTAAVSYKHSLNFKMVPGREITMNTVAIAGNHPKIITYGLSVDFKLDGWHDVLRIVGTMNYNRSNFDVNMIVSQGVDEVAKLDSKYTEPIAGFSRTEIKVDVTNYLDLESTADVIVNKETFKLGMSGNLLWLERSLKGSVNFNWIDKITGDAELMIFIPGLEEILTHYYNATVAVDPEERTIFSRQELREDVNGYIELWAAVIQGKIGPTILNGRHFAKAALATPYEDYFVLSGEASSTFEWRSLAVASIVLSADAGASYSYLIGWDLNFKMPSEEGVKTNTYLNKTEVEESTTEVEESDRENELMMLTTLGRLKTPSWGEVKLNIKARRTHVTKVEDPHFSNTVEIRLVTETFPELGRLNAKLTHNSDAYSLSTRIWSGPMSMSLETYGIAREESLKSSTSVTIIAPSSSWQNFEGTVEGDHLGEFPFNFETSFQVSAKMRHNNIGSFTALAQWTPSTAALNLGLRIASNNVPGGQIFLKWTTSSFQYRIAFLNLTTMFTAKRAEMGRKLDLALSFSYPPIFLNDIDSTVNLYIREDHLVIPNIIVLKWRFSVNAVNHWIFNVDLKMKEKKVTIKGGVIRPNDPASFSLEFAGFNDIYHGKGTLVIDAISNHITITLASAEMIVILSSSLLPEPNGYVFRVFYKDEKIKELGIIYREGNQLPLWSYSYRLKVQQEYSRENRLEKAYVDDFYVYGENETNIATKKFFDLALELQDTLETYKVNIGFPEWLPDSSVVGSIRWMRGGEKEISSQLSLDVPENEHTLETSLFYDGNSITNWRHGRMVYRQQLIKGVGHLFRFELEGRKLYDGQKDFRFNLQHLFRELKLSKGEPQTTKGGPLESKLISKTIQGRFSLLQSSSLDEYKLLWETDDSRNEAKLSIEKDSTGKGANLRYERTPLRNPEDKDWFEVKGNFKEFPSEFTCSLTLEHVSIGRPRSLTFLHSDAEAYTEIVLDVYKSEEDQIIMVLNRKKEEKSFRVGQFGNNFVHFARTLQAKDGPSHTHQSILAEIGYHVLEVRFGVSTPHEKCWLLYFILSTPNLARNYNGLTFCFDSNIEVVVQMLGYEEGEGPYIRLGEISGPGGLGVQVGGGRLHPLDTPPAVTLMGSMREYFYEILLHCKVNFMSQLVDDLYLRKDGFEKAVAKLPELKLEVKGTLGIDKALEDNHRLLEDATLVLKPFKRKILASLGEEKWALARNLSDAAYDWVTSRKEETIDGVEEGLATGQRWLRGRLRMAQNWIRESEFHVQEVVDYYSQDWVKSYKADFFPLWMQIAGTLRAIRFNDNQSLYALVSRTMSSVHMALGRQKGFNGFVFNDLLTKTEQILARRMQWGNIKTDIISMIRELEEIIPITFIATHDAAFKIQIPPLEEFWKKVRYNVHRKFAPADLWVRSNRFFKGESRKFYLRFLQLKSWEIKGSATIFGWEQAISLDGLYLSSLLTDSCPHMLLMLTRPSAPVAITLHLQNENETLKVLTFFSRKNEIALFSNFKIKVNGKDFNQETKVIDDLYIEKSAGKVLISSSEGVILECYSRGDFCTVQTGKENFASTTGLLGVFDTETTTDYMTSSWERPASTAEWLSSWRFPTAETCDDVPFPATLPSHNQEDECSRQFAGSVSPFEECLNYVSGKPYEDVCIGGRLCSAEEALKSECKANFLDTNETLLSCGPPDVALQQSGDVKEGGKVHFRCLVTSVPPALKVEFYHDKNIIEAKETGEVSLAGTTLTLHDITPSYTGNYFCRVTNALGSTDSDTIKLEFKHKPVCAHDRKIIDAVRGEMVVLECKIKANPPDAEFNWSYDNGDEFMRLSESTFTSSQMVSRLKFVPKSESDFGEGRCWASNEIGTQDNPCEFVVNPAQVSEGCTEPPQEMTETVNLAEEIVFIGEFSCIDSIKQIVQFLKKESERHVRLLLRYRSERDQLESFKDFDEVIASFDGSTLDLISTSIEKDFSSDSLKAIILFNCEPKECKSENKDEVNKALALSDTMRNLGIQFYTVTKEPLLLKERNSISGKMKRQLIGMDRRTAYLMSHARKKRLKGKRSVRKELSLPENNICAELSLQSDGAVFSLRVWRKMKKNSHKRAFQQFIAYRVLDGHRKEYLECRNCACQLLCTLCTPIPPFKSEILNLDDQNEDDFEDYYY